MRVLIVLMMTIVSLYSANMGVILVDNGKLHYDDSLKKEIEGIFKDQDTNYGGGNTLEVTIDRERKIKRIYSTSGAVGLIKYAKGKNYASIAMVEYKKGSRILSYSVLIVDEKVQDRKSKSTAFSPSLGRVLAKTVLSDVLTLNYELGVLHVKNVY